MMPTARYRRTCTLALIALLPLTVIAQEERATEADTSETPLVLPAAPQSAQLLPFYVSGTTTLRFMIDADSVSVTPEGIVRFTLVAMSDQGATNVSHEGIRCKSAEKKLYATGRPDGSWSPARRKSWEPIRDVGANRQHAALVKDYFCDGDSVAGKAESIVGRLRKNKPLR